MFARFPFVLIVLSLLAAAPQGLRAQQCENYHTISVTPVESDPITVDANTTHNVVHFTVVNTAPVEGEDCQGVFPLTVTSTGPITVDSWYPQTLWLWRGESSPVDVTFSTSDVGTGSVTLARTGYEGTQSGSIGVSVVAPHGPRVEVAEHQTARDVSKCVADCFEAVATYSTPPYYSLDQPRSVQLVYRSALAHPMGFVSVRAWDTTAVRPAKMSIRLQDAAGYDRTFTNGSTEFFFACDTSGASTACTSPLNRLAVQFDASTWPTGSYPHTVIVRSYRPDSTFYETKTRIRVLIQNESLSPFGAGWIIAGYQRVHVVGDSLLITDGNGSIAFFEPTSPAPCSPCSYASPTGDFTTVIRTVGAWGTVYRRRYPDGTTVVFRQLLDNRMWLIEDSRGTEQTFYPIDASNQLSSILDFAGKFNDLGYENGKLRWMVSPGGRADSITIDGSGNLTQIKDAAGGLAFQGTYDGLHRLTRVIDRRGSARGIAYDFAGKLKADTAPPITTVHGSNERPVVRYLSLETVLLSDTALHLGSSGSPAAASNDVTVRATVTSARGFTTAYALDAYGQPLRVEEPQGRTATFQYDALGRRTRDSLPEGQGHVIRYTWAGPNQTQWKDSTTGRTINYTYDTTYNLLTSRWGDVPTLNNWLSSDKRAVDSSGIFGAARRTRYSYLSAPHHHHSCTSAGPSTGYWATCTFPSGTGFRNTDSTRTVGYVQSPGVPAWGRAHYQYDIHGQRIRTVNAVGDTTWTEYDVLGRVKTTIGPQHEQTAYTYDSLYLTRITDARGQIYRVFPNALGWPDSTADPAGKITRFTYDSGGNQVTIVNRRGQTIQFTYDSLDQMRLRIVGTDTTKFFTDPLGRYSAMANRASVDTVKVDSAGRPWVEVSCRILVTGSPHQCFRDSSAYEWHDFRTKLMVTAPGLWSTHTATYSYDGLDQLRTLTNFTGEQEALNYDGELRDSARVYLAFTPNLTLTRGRAPYSPFGGSATLGFSDTALTRQIGLGHSYDTLSRAIRQLHGTLAKPDTIRSFVDSAGRLFRFADTVYTWTSAACSPGVLGQSCDANRVWTKTAVGTPATFYYDSVGNRKDSPTQAYGVDPGNRLRRLGYLRMDYDFDGNLTQKRALSPTDTTKVLQTEVFFWNALSQLDSLKTLDSTGTLTTKRTFAYDASGRRVRSTFGIGVNSTQRYLWDGNNLIFNLDSLGNRVAYWTFYPGTNEAQSVATKSDTTFYYVTDALHNVVATLKSKGDGGYELFNQRRYGPFGEATSVTGQATAAMRLGYKGAFSEGTYYLMGARYYDPSVGRFISEDPLGLEAGINQYAFAGGDPVNGYDPKGTFPLGILGAALIFGSNAAQAALAGASFTSALYAGIHALAATTMQAYSSAMLNEMLGGGSMWQSFDQSMFLNGVLQAGGFLLSRAVPKMSGHTFFVRSSELITCPVTARFQQNWMRTTVWRGDPMYVEGDVNIMRLDSPSSRIGGWAWYAGNVTAVQVAGWGSATLFDGLVMGEISCKAGAGSLTGFKLIMDHTP